MMIQEAVLTDEAKQLDTQGFNDYCQKKLGEMKIASKPGWFLSSKNWD